MSSHPRKRSYDDYTEPPETSHTPREERNDHQDSSNSPNMTKRSRKKHRGRDHSRQESGTTSNENGSKPTSTKPGLQFASHNLNSSVKLTDLRDLVLYCMADGVAPNWISVQNKSQFQKAVVLMVPGLEKGMFDGSISLEAPVVTALPLSTGDEAAANENAVDPETGDKDANDEVKLGASNEDEWTTVNRRKSKQPDDFLPSKLVEEDLPEPLKPLAEIFDHLWPIRTPGDDRYSKVHSPLHSILQKSIASTPEEKNQRRNAKGARPVKVKEDFAVKKTPITEFIASAEELRDNGYTIHPDMLLNDDEKKQELVRRERLSTNESSGWKDTKVDTETADASKDEESTNDNITDGRTIYAIDCEMCMVGDDESALTRLSVLAWDGTTIMDELVKPEKPITNYLTQYSGISEEMLKHVTTSLSDIQERLLKLFTPDTILVGHSLDSDLKALKLTHPYIVDTSIIYPHPRGPPMKSSLKWLCQKYLSREIQKGHGSKGHNSVEDAQACLDLVRLKCEKGKQWGTPDAVHESIFKALARKQKSGLPSGVNEGRQGAIVDLGSPERNFGQQATYSIGCKDDDSVVDAVKRCVLGDPDGEYIPGGGVELTWARLRELDYLRGWANNNRGDDPFATSSNPSPSDLAAGVSRTVSRIKNIHDFLPPCTLLIVYTGTGEPRELGRLQDMERQFKKEYTVRKWDELTVKWTDDEAQALRRACEKARSGMGLMCVT